MAALTDEVAAFYAHQIDAAESPHTDLDEVPGEAEIQFASGVTRTKLGASMTPGEKGRVSDAVFNDTLAEGIVLKPLIVRAMIDPDAEVIPL